MKTILSKGILGIMLIGFQFALGQNVNQKVDTSIFPKPEKGFEQFVIEVPHSSIDEDANKKVEIIVGKYASVDTCNRQFLMGELESKDLQGWGYNYYTFNTNGNIGGTMMVCNNSEKVEKFVAAQGFMTDYNGRMPIVVYVPEGYQVQYKIYKAEPETYQAMQVVRK